MCWLSGKLINTSHASFLCSWWEATVRDPPQVSVAFACHIHAAASAECCPFNEDECFPINVTHCSMTSSFPMLQPCDFQLSSRWRTDHSAFTFSPLQFVRTTSLLWFIWRTYAPFPGYFSFISTYQPSFHLFLFLLLEKWRADMRLCPFSCKVTWEGDGC